MNDPLLRARRRLCAGLLLRVFEDVSKAAMHGSSLAVASRSKDAWWSASCLADWLESVAKLAKQAAMEARAVEAMAAAEMEDERLAALQALGGLDEAA